MRSLILDGGPIQAAFETRQDATALALLNTATQQVVVLGRVNALGMEEAESTQFVGEFIRAINAQIALYNASADDAVKSLGSALTVHMTMFGGDGIDLTRNKTRKAVGDALQAQGWTNSKRNKVLDLGYVTKSKPQVQYARDAAQSDLDALRRTLYEEMVVARSINAAALFQSRMEQSVTPWDAAEQAAQWAGAWEGV